MPLTLTPNEYRKPVVKRFFLIFLPLCLLVSFTAFTHYQTRLKFELIQLTAHETLNVDRAREVINNDLYSVISDLTFLAKLNELETLLNEPENNQARHALAREFFHFSEKKRLYAQIRVVDLSGQEIVRINYARGVPQIVPDEKLQNKSDRYYIKEAAALEQGEIYISPFDLNVEEDEIEQPYSPMIRFATPLFDDAGNKRAVLLFNFLGERLIRNFRRATRDIEGDVSLVNADGFWLNSQYPERDWGFIFGRGRSFAQEQPMVWKKILSSSNGRINTSSGIYTYTTIYVIAPDTHQNMNGSNPYITTLKYNLPNNQPRFWKIISHLPTAKLQDISQKIIGTLTLPYAASILFFLLGSLILAWISIKHRIKREQAAFNHRFRKTLENIELAAITLNNQGKIVYCNQYFLKITGYDADSVLGRDWFNHFLPLEDQARARHLFNELISGKAHLSTPITRIVCKNSQVRLISWNNTLSYQPAGKIIALTAIGQDITQQHKAEEQLRKLSQAVEQSPNPVMISNKIGTIEYINHKFTELTGYSADEAIGKHTSILKSGETRPEEYKKLWKTISAGKEWHGIFHNRKKNGELFWEKATISPIRNAQGKITHYLGIKEDITERRWLTDKVATQNQELLQAQTLAAMGRMATMIAHDLRNPLSSIKMSLKILGKRAETGGNKEASELKQIALDQILYMEEILADMLTFSRPDDLKLEWLNINKVLDQAIAINERSVRDHGANIHTEYQPQLPTLHGDPIKLQQAFSNLITNALESTDELPHKPNILIRAKLQVIDSLPKVQIDIEDNGRGMTPEQAEQLFEPFFTTRAKGTGLGLTIVKRILEQHHATITLTATESGGTCATVTLPVAPIREQNNDRKLSDNLPYRDAATS